MKRAVLSLMSLMGLALVTRRAVRVLTPLDT